MTPPLHDLIDRILQRVAELPDRTSPDDWPEAMLVTADELRNILADELEAALDNVTDRISGHAHENAERVSGVPQGSRDASQGESPAQSPVVAPPPPPTPGCPRCGLFSGRLPCLDCERPLVTP